MYIRSEKGHTRQLSHPGHTITHKLQQADVPGQEDNLCLSETSFESVYEGFLDHALRFRHKKELTFDKSERTDKIEPEKTYTEREIPLFNPIKAATSLVEQLKSISDELKRAEPPISAINRLKCFIKIPNTQTKLILRKASESGEFSTTKILPSKRLSFATPGCKSPKSINTPIILPKIKNSSTEIGMSRPHKSLVKLLLTPLSSEMRGKHQIEPELSIPQPILRITRKRKIKKGEVRINEVNRVYGVNQVNEIRTSNISIFNTDEGTPGKLKFGNMLARPTLKRILIKKYNQ